MKTLKKLLAVFSLSLMLSCSGSTLPFNVILYHPGARAPVPGIPQEAWNFCHDQITNQTRELGVRERLGPKKAMCLHTMLMEVCIAHLRDINFLQKFNPSFDIEYDEFSDWLSEYREDCLPVWDPELESIRRAFGEALRAERLVCP